MKKMFTLAALVCNILAVIALLVSYLARFVSPEEFYALAFFGLAYPLLVLINAAFIVIWIIAFRIYFVFSLAGILIGINLLPGFIQINSKKTEAGPGKLNILSFNTHYMGAYEPRIFDSTLFFESIEKIKPDIFCFQEFVNFHGVKESRMYNRFFRKYKDYFYANADAFSASGPTGYGVCIFSRYPIVRYGFVEKVMETG